MHTFYNRTVNLFLLCFEIPVVYDCFYEICTTTTLKHVMESCTLKHRLLTQQAVYHLRSKNQHVLIKNQEHYIVLKHFNFKMLSIIINVKLMNFSTSTTGGQASGPPTIVTKKIRSSTMPRYTTINDGTTSIPNPESGSRSTSTHTNSNSNTRNRLKIGEIFKIKLEKLPNNGGIVLNGMTDTDLIEIHKLSELIELDFPLFREWQWIFGENPQLPKFSIDAIDTSDIKKTRNDNGLLSLCVYYTFIRFRRIDL